MSVKPEQVDGNVVRGGIKLKDEFVDKFLGPQGYFTKLFTIIDVHLLIFIIGVQSSMLNYYILKYNSMLPYYYILWGIDFVTIVTILWSIVTAKKYFELQDRIENPTYYADGIDCNPANNYGHQVLFCKLPKKLGVLPFIYLCWLIYTLSLISKILIIFITNVPNHMLNEGFKMGPQTLEMVFALTSIIFLVFMYAHRNSENEYHKNLTKPWIDDMISHAVFEIFDSIIFIDLVMPERDHHNDHEIKHSVRESIGPCLEYTIIGLASANFLLPTINLYHLSQLSACRNEECKRIDLKGKLRHILIHFLRLVSVNIAYLVVRVYVSQNNDKAITIFIIKNVLCIIMSIRSLFIEINEYLTAKKHFNQGSSTNGGIDKQGGDSRYNHDHAYELQNLTGNATNKLVQNGSRNSIINTNRIDSTPNDIPNVDNFENISLK